MLILIDLDGTILNSVHPSWKPYKDGQDNCCIEHYLDRLPFIPGSKEFLQTQMQKGNKVVIVSDSHPKYVGPISKYLGCDYVSLADKPNSSNVLSYIESHFDCKEMLELGDCVLIGDTVLDVELGRRLGIPTIWIVPYVITDDIKSEKDKVGDEISSLKMGPTYTAKSFEEIQQILDNPVNNLYIIESLFAGGDSLRVINYCQNRYLDGSYTEVKCLARQESGLCDRYARADKYYCIANPDRTEKLVAILAKGISLYLNQPMVIGQGWDYITYLPDKQYTVPRNKMKEIFDMVETPIQKVQLLKWSDTVDGSLRDRNFYNERKKFLEQYLYVNVVESKVDELSQTNNKERFNIKGKNIVVIDDQLTTSATAWYVIHELKAKGAKNVLFIALFQMVFSVESNVLCPNCGKPMVIKIRRRDGYKFYSCMPPEYGGDGCGYSIDYQRNEPLFFKYLKIVKSNECAFKKFIYGRQGIKSNMQEYIVDSENKIQLISEMCSDNLSYISDQDIEELFILRDKANEELFNHPLRKSIWKEWVFKELGSDCLFCRRDVLKWILKNLEKLDKYIKKDE